MTNLQPYPYEKHGSDYEFVSDTNIDFTISFSDGSTQFFNLPEYIPVFDLAIYSPSNQAPFDVRVSATVIAILKDFFQERSNSIIYTCENLDGRHRARSRKFSAWFDKANDGQFQKVNLDFDIEGIEVLSSLIVHIENPFKKEIIDIFLNQPDFYRDKLE
jgi:Family of unknown function (DUF6169)